MNDAAKAYQELLVAEESLSALDQALELALRIASGVGGGEKRGWVNIVNGKAPGPEMGRRAERGQVRRIRDTTWALTKLPRLVDEARGLPESQYSLLMDTLLLAFHQAYFVLLPKAGSKRTALLSALDAFTNLVPRQADRFYLQGLIQLEYGNAADALDYFSASLAFTHADEYEFLTVVQTVWSLLMDQGHYVEAFKFLLELDPRVARRDLGEWRELLYTTYSESLEKCGNSA